jgi:hypothetical protein
MAFIPTDNFETAVSRGARDGFALYHVYAATVATTTTSDIWDIQSTYPFQTVAGIHYLSSSNSGDTNQPIFIAGLDASGAYAQETRNLDAVDAQTQVATVNSYSRIVYAQHKATGGGLGGAASLLGDVYLANVLGATGGVPNVTTDIKAKIQQGNGKTRSSIVSAPLGMTMFLYNFGYHTQSGNKEITTTLNIREFGSNKILTDEIIAVNTNFQHFIELKPPIPERSDFYISTSVVAGTEIVQTIYDMLLVRNDLVSPLKFS